MNIKIEELFKIQLEESVPLTEDEWDKLKNTEYFNGDPIRIGDKVLYALLDESQCGDDMSRVVKLICINEKHFDLFDSHDISKSDVPIIFLK